MQEIRNQSREVFLVDFAEAIAQFDHYIKENHWDGRSAPVSEIWAFAFKELFGKRQPMDYDFFYVNRHLILAAQFILNTHLDRLLGKRKFIRGRICGKLAVIWTHG